MKNALLELQDLLDPLLIKNSKEDLIEYGRDWTRFLDPDPLCIVFPKTTEHVQKIVQWARKHKAPLVPSGGRTGLSGAVVAGKKEVVVSFEKMNQILDFNKTNTTLTVEPGVITEAVQNYAEEKGYYFPVDFASRGSSQIGGNVATNAGGIKVIRYGLIRNWIAGLKVVTGTGALLSLNNSLIKNASGYDLRHLIIGSEGTLGFITEVTLNLTKKPPSSKVLLLGVPSLESVMEIFQVFRDSNEILAFELFTDTALKYVLEATDLKKPFEEEAPIYILIEVETPSDLQEELALKSFEQCVEKDWVLTGVISQNQTQAKEFWRLREDIAESLSKYTPYKNDVSVSIANVPAFMMETDSVLKNQYPDFDVVWFGHIGDGNLHISILKPSNIPMSEFVNRCRQVDKTLYETIKKFHGSVSAEHGVGLSKKPYLNMGRSEEEISILKGIKRVFDPDGLLNPGKIFDL